MLSFAVNMKKLSDFTYITYTVVITMLIVSVTDVRLCLDWSETVI